MPLLVHFPVEVPTLTLPFKLTFALLAQTVWLFPALTTGKGFTVTVIAPLLTQPVAIDVIVSVYVVVSVGLATGSEAVVELNAVAVVQLYAFPATEAEPILTAEPMQMEVLEPGFTAGSGITVIVTVLVFTFVHPVAVIVSTKA